MSDHKVGDRVGPVRVRQLKVGDRVQLIDEPGRTGTVFEVPATLLGAPLHERIGVEMDNRRECEVLLREPEAFELVDEGCRECGGWDGRHVVSCSGSSSEVKP